MQNVIDRPWSRRRRSLSYNEDPTHIIGRSMNETESRAASKFEKHARKCTHCHSLRQMPRDHEELCASGHHLAQDILRCMHMEPDGGVYSTVNEHDEPVPIRFPALEGQVFSLLKAEQVSLSGLERPSVPMDSSYAGLLRSNSDTGRKTRVLQPRRRSSCTTVSPSETSFIPISHGATKIRRMRSAQELRSPLRAGERTNCGSTSSLQQNPSEQGLSEEDYSINASRRKASEPSTGSRILRARRDFGIDIEDSFNLDPCSDSSSSYSTEPEHEGEGAVERRLISRHWTHPAPPSEPGSKETKIQPEEPMIPPSNDVNFQKMVQRVVSRDCIDILKQEYPLRHLHIYALATLGQDRFVTEYSNVLPRCYGVSDKTNDSIIGPRGGFHVQPLSDWNPVASDVASYLRAVGTDGKSWTPNTLTGPSFIQESLARESESHNPKSLEVLARDLALLTLRRSLQEMVSSTTLCAIELSSVNDESFVNNIQTLIENYTTVEWDWWPLAPCVPHVAPEVPEECRIQWKLGGVPLYEIVSSVEKNVIWWVMRSWPHDKKQCSYCRTDSSGKVSKPWNISAAWFRAAAGGSSRASQRYTPTSTSATSAPVASPQTAGGVNSNLSAPGSASSPLQVLGQPATVPSKTVPGPSLRVLFGVQGSRWSLEVEQISVTALLNDPAFFRELKTRYKKHRSWIKRLISPFRFRFCRFVKLEKFDAGRVLSQGDDLPDYPGVKDDYEYTPRPGTIPMISPKTFAVCLKACDMNCKWPWLNPWHDCVSLPCRSYRLGCIPKKKSEFDIQSNDAIAVAWGLEADHAISFAFMAVYHLVPLLAAFVFWIYWLIKFPGDWQNAAVPVLTVLAIFAVLWVPFGKHLGIV